MTVLADLRIKKNIGVKNIYYLLNLEGFFIIFHNNKNFTKFKNKILFSNRVNCFIIKNKLFLNIINKKQDSLFLNLFVGPSGIVFLENQENLFKFFDFYFMLNSSEQLDFLLLGVYWRLKNRFLSLEYMFNFVTKLKDYKSVSEFIISNYSLILQKINDPLFSLIKLLNFFIINFFICLNFLESNLKKEK